MVLIVAGVSGSGKTTIGRRVAERMGFEFVEGDDFHPAANVEKMRSGAPLDDTDRRPWLAALREKIEAWTADGRNVVLTCSALKRAHRRALGLGEPGSILIHLSADPRLIEERVRQRRGHFMPASLLDSQLRTLEPPAAEERAIEVDASGSPDAVAEQVVAELAGRGVTAARHRF